MTAFAAAVLDAEVDAMLASDDEHHAVGACPSCGAIIAIDWDMKFAGHFTPICADWARFMEDWEPSA